MVDGSFFAVLVAYVKLPAVGALEASLNLLK
jgi:hypothetical protein